MKRWRNTKKCPGKLGYDPVVFNLGSPQRNDNLKSCEMKLYKSTAHYYL